MSWGEGEEISFRKCKGDDIAHIKKGDKSLPLKEKGDEGFGRD